jgi:hypothetical protein
VKATFEPDRAFDIGRGKGQRAETQISGGVVGIILDGRGRPYAPPEDNTTRVAKLKEWMTELEVYPAEALEELT